MQRLVILISGQGSNMLALARACRQEAWPATIASVISNREDAGGLAKAADLGLPVLALPVKPGENRDQYDLRLGDHIEGLGADWVILAGFMRILSAGFVARFSGKIINIHPSLLPAFPGLHTHQRAIDAGAARHGATVHFVVPELDAGPMIVQAGLDVLADDTESALAARVLTLEHQIYPRAMRMLLKGEIDFARASVRLAGGSAS